MSQDEAKSIVSRPTSTGHCCLDIDSTFELSLSVCRKLEMQSQPLLGHGIDTAELDSTSPTLL